MDHGNGNFKSQKPSELWGLYATRMERLEREDKCLRRMPRDVRLHWLKQEQLKIQSGIQRRVQRPTNVHGFSLKTPRSALAQAGKSVMDNVVPQIGREGSKADPGRAQFQMDTKGKTLLPIVPSSNEDPASSSETKRSDQGKKEEKHATKKRDQSQDPSHHGAPALCRLSFDLGVPVEDIRTAKILFDRYDQDPRDGTLDKEEFRAMLGEMINARTEVDEMLEAAWKKADVDKDGGISFLEFAKWYSTHSFAENVVLDEDQCAVRNLARKYDLSLVEVERIKGEFNRFDEDGSGEIEYDEFVKILYKLLKVPDHLPLPQTRINNFWNEIDEDGSGSVDFEEFLVWYLKYFGDAEEGSSPLEEFYNVRRFSVPRDL